MCYESIEQKKLKQKVLQTTKKSMICFTVILDCKIPSLLVLLVSNNSLLPSPS